MLFVGLVGRSFKTKGIVFIVFDSKDFSPIPFSEILKFEMLINYYFEILKCSDGAPASFWISWPAGWLPGYFKIHTLVMDFSSFHLSKETVDLFNSYKSDFPIRPFTYVSPITIRSKWDPFCSPWRIFFSFRHAH